LGIGTVPLRLFSHLPGGSLRGRELIGVWVVEDGCVVDVAWADSVC
jgi:hypothetical protein